ncbi:unnamed protein product [Coregonus sp. 'balchen']|nr:unnamed protein product [Coregonus sp. 'balchen']
MEAQWVPNLLELPAHTQINYMVTDLEGGPWPSSPVEDSYRANILTRGMFPGQLTTVGMQQLYELGERLRKRTVPILIIEAESEILYPNYHECRLLKLLSGHRWAESDDTMARETHGLPCPPVLDSWRSTVEQRALEMICHIYEPSKRENLQLCVGSCSSAHYTTLIPCLMALGVFDMRWPPYATDITLELHQHRQTKEAFVKVSYIGKDQLIPGCSGVYCPLQEFKQAFSNFSLTSELYESLCNRTEGAADL